MSTDPGDTPTLNPTFFLILDDGTVWSYDRLEDVSLSLIGASIDHVRAWDATGRRVWLASDDGDGVAMIGAGELDQDELRGLLIERLRTHNVKSVDLLAFDDVIFKASIRLVGPTRRNARTNFFVSLFANLMELFRGP
jgi:hypothetical protein